MKKHIVILALLAVIIAVSVYLLSGSALIGSGKESPAILTAEYDGSVHVIYLTLREDGTYRMNNENSYRGSKYYNGTYSMNKDTIILDRSISIGDVCMSQKWLLQQDRIWFYTYFPDENIIHEDSLYFTIKTNNIKNF